MRLSLFALAMCLVWFAGSASAEASAMFGYDEDRTERSHAAWTGKRHYSGRQHSQHRDSYRQTSERRYSRREYSRSNYAYRQSAHRQYAQRRSYGGRTYASTGGESVGGRPRAWCGWWMRTQLGGGPEYNLAANWRNYGHSSGPQVGAVVVWPHHVGIITGRTASGQWVVKSGNDGNAVRERPQSVSGAVFRVG